MRRLSWLSAAFVLAAAPSSALAADHLIKISEVLLSQDGDTGIQYVEMLDTANEPFTLGDPYRLEVYDVDANLIDSVTLTSIHGSAEPGTPDPYYVATTAANAEFGPDGEDTLDVQLPAEGQACIVRDNGAKIHCLAWGCVNTAAGPALDTSTGPAPADGESLQRQSGGAYQTGAPTPDAANIAGTGGPACPGAPDAGVEPDADPGAPDASPDDPDAGGGGGGGDDDDGGGCCQTSDRGAAGSIALGLLGLLALRRRRR